MTGRFITLEGGEGAGKSTVLDAVRERLAARGIDVVVTREPGGTPFAEAVRALVLDPARGEMCPESELLLMFAARAQHVREIIQPALASGRWVLSDRYTDASYAYQGGGRGQPVERIAALESWAAPVRPDLTLLLDLPVADGLARAGARGAADRIEREALDFFERVRAAYRARAVAEPVRFRVVDSSQPIGAVREAVGTVLDEWLDGIGAAE
ncbi:dTMP kinase [Dokdonella sp.]|uniref:dTMP kinase n=1 Tax=Dokdonella sp. TaxID=2291710 RepID=UPI00263A3900|nr:dTMP kinase [Dokdonella sp.]